jgi:DNA-binding winged helix-turn-helix (wHTH) protein/tetratricopeptide (TPR) repeat protein
LLYSFEDFTFDTDLRELRRGADLIDLEPQVFDLLAYLIRNRDRVATRDDLIASVWGGRIVSESALSTRINAARSALADSGKQQRLIKTLLRRGVRFVGTVREHDKSAALTAESAPVKEPELPAVARPASGAELGADESLEPGAVSAATTAFSSGRRQLTVLSCELVIPTELSSRMELEDLRETVEVFYRRVSAAAARFTGVVARRVGSFAVVNFGYPAAHEDDAEQAVRAGLELCAAATSIVPHAQPPCQARAGIATGEVIVSEAPKSGAIAGEILVGEAPTLSRRLQILAWPGTVVVDRTTKLLIGDLFDCRSLGAVDEQGLSQAAQAWRVEASRTVESRFAALHSGMLTPLVGREEEIDLLCRRWTQSRAGELRAILISGEAGIGKSRLIAALEERTASDRYARFHYSCSPRHTESALHPVIVQLEQSAGFDRKNSPQERFAKLSAMLDRTATTTEDLALACDLLSLPISDRLPPLNLSPQRRKEKTAEALVRQVAKTAQRTPVLVIFEDIHWIDPSSLDVLSLMIERLRASPVLVLATLRPDFPPPWVGQPNVTVISLSRLGRQEGESLVLAVAGDKYISPEVVAAIAERTDGVPLFAEEVTKAMLEVEHSQSPHAVASSRSLSLVPTSLQASLMARLDRLGPGKQIAEIGAAIGREFSYELIAAISGLSEGELQSSIARLVDSGLVFRRGVPPAATFMFKHALIQDTAYNGLLRESRRQLHARIAAALQERFADIADEQPEMLAHHCEQAGNLDVALKYWVKAGDLAGRRSASREAAAHYRAALASLERQPNVTEVDAMEAEICMKLGSALMQSEGYGSVSAIEAYRRAQNRAVALNRPEDYAKAISGLAPLLFSSCHYEEVVNTIEQTLEEKIGQLRAHSRIHLHTMLGVGNYCLGRFVAAWNQFEVARTLDRDSPCTHHNPVGGGDPAIVIRNYMGLTGCVLGRIAESLRLTDEGLSLARERGDAFSLAWALLGHVRALRAVGRFADGMPYANEAVELCERHGFRAREGSVLMARGTLLLGLGNPERGLEEMYRGTNIWQETSGNFHMSEWLSYLVDRLWRFGRLEEADRMLRDAERIVEQTEEKSHLAELRRLRGNILYRSGSVAEAQLRLDEAIAWSRERKAKMFELRALRDLAQIKMREGKADHAAALLKRGLTLFADGPVFSELREATQLLDEL